MRVNIKVILLVLIGASSAQECFNQAKFPKLLSAIGQPDNSYYTAITGRGDQIYAAGSSEEKDLTD